MGILLGLWYSPLPYKYCESRGIKDARRQASKYGIKGSRLNDAKMVLDYVGNRGIYSYGPGSPEVKLKDVWDDLPIGENIIKHIDVDSNGVKMYEVCNRKIGETSTLLYLYDVVKKFHDAYGARAKQAADNKGIDWKAVSHALRAAYQIKELLIDNTISFPLKEADYLIKVKQGKLDFLKDVSPKLDELMDEVELLTKCSDLPEQVDTKYWDDFIIRVLEEKLWKNT